MHRQTERDTHTQAERENQRMSMRNFVLSSFDLIITREIITRERIKERETERHKARDTHTETHTDTEAEGQRDRQTGTQRQR